MSSQLERNLKLKPTLNLISFILTINAFLLVSMIIGKYL
jgi:hypothetical protein